MGFIDGLPSSQGKDCIMVAVDRPVQACPVYLSVSSLHCHYRRQVSYWQCLQAPLYAFIYCQWQGPNFVSAFWREFFKLQGTQLCHSSAYHPQSDGQSEIVNWCLETYLRCFAGSKPNEWVKWLSLAEWWYNTNTHPSTGLTPYEVVYGVPPPCLLTYVAGTTRVQAMEDELKSRDQIIQLLKEHLMAAQERMKRMADPHQLNMSFLWGIGST